MSNASDISNSIPLSPGIVLQVSANASWTATCNCEVIAQVFATTSGAVIINGVLVAQSNTGAEKRFYLAKGQALSVSGTSFSVLVMARSIK